MLLDHGADTSCLQHCFGDDIKVAVVAVAVVAVAVVVVVVMKTNALT